MFYKNARKKSIFTEDEELDLTPLIDVVFLILIFFLLTLNFIKEKELIKIEIPKSSVGKEQKVVDDAVEITISKEGYYQIGEENTLLTKKDLATELKPVAENKKFAVIRSDKDTPFEYFIYLDSILTEFGIEQKAIMVKTSK